jgi:glycosyltransferase involved in cell wall biosynthesis
MNILAMAYCCEPNVGSEPNRSWNHILILAQRYRVDVITHPRNRAGIERFPPIPGITFHYVDIGTLLDPWKKFKAEVLGSFRYTLWQVAALLAARRLHRKIHFNAVIQLSLGSLTAPQFACFIGPPLIWGPIGGGHMFPLRMVSFLRYRLFWEIARNMRVSIARWLPWVRATARRASIVLVTNPDTEGIALACGARDVRLVNDIALQESWYPRETEAISQRNPYAVVWVGRLEEHKAPILALAAFRKVREVVPAELVVIGDGSMTGACRAYVNANNMSECVRFLGQLTHEEVRQQVRNAALFLFTSLRDSLPTAAFEALSQGTPVAILDHQGAVQLPDDTSVKVAVTSPAETILHLASAVSDLLMSPEKLRKMSAAGESYAARTLFPRESSVLTEAIETIRLDITAESRCLEK